jgi:DNA-binding IscR family transcriptional regulator
MGCLELPPRIYESLKILCRLAEVNEPLQAHEVAVATTLPPAQTAKILQQMTWAGFVASRRGTNGGFWLIKPADHIRVKDVLSFFAPHGPKRAADPLLASLGRITANCKKEFDRVTIADLAKPSSRPRLQIRQPHKHLTVLYPRVQPRKKALVVKGIDYET